MCCCPVLRRCRASSLDLWRRVGSNHRPIDYEPIALTTELRRLIVPCPTPIDRTRMGPGSRSRGRKGPASVPPAGLEPAQPAPEAGALSSELRGRGDHQRRSGFHTPDSVWSVICLRPPVPKGAADLAETTGSRSPGACGCDGTRGNPVSRIRRAHPPCCRGCLACVPSSPRSTLAFPASFHPCRKQGPKPCRRQVCSLLRLLSPDLAIRRPRLRFRGAHLYVAVGKFL